MPRIYLSPPHLGGRELALVTDALASNWIAPLGPHVDAFERELAVAVEVPHALALSSGTAALHLALIVAGVGPGDHVATSTLTFAATANAITYVGAIPVFIDCDASWTMDPALLEAELVESRERGVPIKAVIAVDLYGQSCDYARLRASCDRHGAVLVQDAAEALGSTTAGRPVGGQGDLAAFSFNGNKIITTSGGGMLVTEDEQAARTARFLATQARDPAPHYEHSQIGYNYRLSNLLAAVGRGQLSVLDQRVAARRAIFERYQAALGDVPGISFMPEPPGRHSTRWLTCIVVDPAQFGATREDIRLALEAENIEARPIWKPMHLQPVFRGCRTFGGAVSARLFADGLCLPSGSNLAESDQTRVIEIVRRQTRSSR